MIKIYLSRENRSARVVKTIPGNFDMIPRTLTQFRRDWTGLNRKYRQVTKVLFKTISQLWTSAKKRETLVPFHCSARNKRTQLLHVAAMLA